MTADQFRRLALGLPDVSEGAHQGHADFRVSGKIFATLGPDEDWAMVKLTPHEQSSRVLEEPDVFEPISGAWGRQGCTRITLASAGEAAVELALVAAWRNIAPEDLVRQHDGD